jgi:hypothetical protein
MQLLHNSGEDFFLYFLIFSSTLLFWALPSGVSLVSIGWDWP